MLVEQGGRFIETEGLDQLPNRQLAVTSFGVEYDTKLLVLSTKDPRHQLSGDIHAVSQVPKQIILDLSKDRMQALADQAYLQLVIDLQAAGYDIIPCNAYKELPVYRLLMDLGSHESPTSFTFRLGDPGHLIQGEGWSSLQPP